MRVAPAGPGVIAVRARVAGRICRMEVVRPEERVLVRLPPGRRRGLGEAGGLSCLLLCAGAEQQVNDVDETPEANRAKGFSEDPVNQVMGIEWRQETRFAHRRVAGLHNRTRLLMASPKPTSAQKMMITKPAALEFMFRIDQMIDSRASSMITT